MFPLGIYTVCTARLAQTTDARWLGALPRVFVYLALAAWVGAFAGLLRSLALQARARAAA